MNIKRNIALVLSLVLCSIAMAHDFVVTIDGQKVYFDIKNEKKKTAIITYKGSITEHTPTYFVGELSIPQKVKHNNKIYTVVGINAKAFSGADKLTGITMPTGISTIGDFAFEGCTSLEKVIFPGNAVKMGEGIFYKCDKIKNISIGSDWTSINFHLFRWSDSLRTITIPAKIEQIKNIKALKHLEKINVDNNNARFSNVDGVLYNKNKETLYCCPRAYKGEVKVAEGTKNITSGALIDCKEVTFIDFPESLATMSFKELSRNENLNEIIFRSTTPIKTAKKGKQEVFLLQVKNTDIKITVNKKSRDIYKQELIQEEGEYTELNGTTPFLVEKSNIVPSKNIRGIKDLP
ncbi:MAG: leucine-rich repeat domain-containing protein [Bacteroidales bacterium]|nr:leucine-rich repeat domain-containing protein [Bacteroidales bacterium]